MVSHRVERWAKIYYAWMAALEMGDKQSSQKLMNTMRHAWLRLDDEERHAAWPYYLEEYACPSS